VGVVLPGEALPRLRVAEGDSILLTNEKNGFRMTRLDSQFEPTMKAARKVMKRRRNALCKPGS